MSSRLRYLLLLLYILAAVFSAHAQLCGKWTVTVDLVDEKGVPVDNASIAFVNLGESDVARRRPIKKDDESAGRFFVTFFEGDRVQNEYDILIKAAGYSDLASTIKISYCHSTAETRQLRSRQQNFYASAASFTRSGF